MRTNQAMPALRRRHAGCVRPTLKGAPGALKGLFVRADACGRAPAGALAAKPIVLATVRSTPHTDFQDP